MISSITMLQDLFSGYFREYYSSEQSLEQNSEMLRWYIDNFEASNEKVVPFEMTKEHEQVLDHFERCYQVDNRNVTLVIPSCNEENVIRAINELGTNTFNIIVMMNNCDFECAKDKIHSGLISSERVQIYNHEFKNNVKFSFAEVCNSAVNNYVSTEFVIFFNDDLLFEAKNLEKLVSYAQFDVFGAVAPALAWENGVVQNAGIFGGVHRNNLPGLYGRGVEYSSIIKTPLPSDAVTGACLVIKTDRFKQFNGFDEENFAIAYNDVDLGYRLNMSGYQTISLNHILAKHAEGASRGVGIGNDNPKEEVAISEKYISYTESFIERPQRLIIDPESGDFLDQLNHPALLVKDKRIVVFTHNMKLEGASRIALDISKLLAESGYEVSVLALEGGEHYDTYRKFASDIYICGWEYFVNEDVRNRVSLWLKDKKIQRVICNTIICSAALYPISKSNNIEQINYIHESESFDSHLRHFGEYWVEQSALSVSKSFNVFVSRYTVNVYRQFLNRNNWTILYNYFETKQNVIEHKNSSDGISFVTVGAICERKNQEMVIDAIEFFENRKINCEFTLVGSRDDDYSNNIKSIFDSKNYKYGVLNIIPETKNVDKYYSKADVFISFSKMESFPITLLEAGIHSLCIISSSVFGAKELVVDDVNGFLYESCNVKSLHSAFEKLLKSNISNLGKNSALLNELWPSKECFSNNILGIVQHNENESKIHNSTYSSRVS